MRQKIRTRSEVSERKLANSRSQRFSETGGKVPDMILAPVELAKQEC